MSIRVAALVVCLATAAWGQLRPNIVWARGGHSLGTNGGFFSPDGSLLATAGDDGTIKIWNPRTGLLVRTIHAHDQFVARVAWSPDGGRLASCAWDGKLKIWDAADGANLLTIAADAQGATAVNWSSDGALVASGGYSAAVKIWNAQTGALVRTLTGHGDYIDDVEFSPDNAMLATCSDDRSIKLWRTSDWGLIRTMANAHDWYVVDVDFSPDGTILASTGGLDAPRLKFWNPQTGALIRTMVSDTFEAGPCDFTNDGARIATSGWWGTRIFDVATGALLDTLTTTDGCEISPDGTLLFGNDEVTGDIDSFALFAFPTGEMVHQLPAHTSAAAAVAFSPGGTFLASGGASFDSSVRIWEAATGARVRELEYSYASDGLARVEFSPDGVYIAGGGCKSSTRVWSTEDGELVAELPQGLVTCVRGLAFSPDGAYLATGVSSGGIVLWAMGPSPFAVSAVSTEQVFAMAYHPHEDWVAVGHPRSITIVHPMSGGLIRTISPAHGGIINDLAFTPDGAHLLSASSDQTVKVWSMATGALVRTLIGHTGEVHSVAVSPDGGTAITGGNDGTVRLWSVATGELLATYTDETGTVGGGTTAVAYSPQGNRFAFGRADGTVAVAASPTACAADMDGDGTLTLADFVQFRNFYVDGDLRSDFDGDGRLTLQDFVAYRNEYVAGCK